MSLPQYTDSQVYQFFCEAFAVMFSAYVLIWLVRRLKRTRTDLAIGRPLLVGFGLRLFAAMGLNQLTVAQDLRGGDELTFIARATNIAHVGIFSKPSTDALTGELHTFVFSLMFRIFHPAPSSMLRIMLIALAIAGVGFMAVAVYELAGPRAAVVAAWVLALEPTNVFFSGVIHKEPFMLFAEGLLAYGGARVWKRGDFTGIFPLVCGCLISIATRPYVGWFFVAGAAAVVLHASIIHRRTDSSIALFAVAILLAGAFIPIAWNKSSHNSLNQLQQSQTANAENTTANLSLEKVDYSTRADVFLNLPKRIKDVVLRPYPWQLQNTSQRLGLIGTMVVLIGLFLLADAFLRGGSDIMRRAGPFVYPALFALCAYALSAGNAGTAFRYRTHVVAFMLCVLVVMREARQEQVEGRQEWRLQKAFGHTQPASSAT